MPPSKSSGSELIVAIDFGTTYSGVAWARSTKPDQVNLVSGWNSDLYTDVEDKQKAPTTIQYDAEGKPSSWGFGCSPSDTRLKWFKILLIDDGDIPEYLTNSREFSNVKRLLKHLNKEPVEVIADYLRLLWQHSLDSIEHALGKALLQTSTFNVVVTLPAIWPAYAQIRMREAVSIAGIIDERVAGETSLHFVSEPEAAALATLADMSDRKDIQAKDNFVVCDAGGGTVDLITYGVTKKRPMTIKESVQGDGDLCGAILLDQQFINLLRSTIPPNILEKLNPSAMFRLINSYWENGLKSKFVDRASDFDIPLPYGGTVEDGFHSPMVKIKSAKMTAIYRPVAERIAWLICKQISRLQDKVKQPPKFVVLVGGFGRNRYLYEFLKENLDIEILQGSGNQPWTAVCRGAVLKGLSLYGIKSGFNLAVDTRIARNSIGTTCNILPWDYKVHDTRDKAWCDVQQDFLAVDQTRWFVRTGDSISSAKPKSLTFWQDLNDEQEEIKTELVYSKSAPKRCDETVKRLCVIKWAKIPKFKDLPEWMNTGGTSYKHLNYEVRMIADSASLDFAIYHDGRRVASKNLAIEFDGSDAPNAARGVTPPPRNQTAQVSGMPTPGAGSDESSP